MKIILSSLAAFSFFILCCHNVSAFEYPVYSKTLSNGLKVIVCTKPGNGMVTVQVWYRTGSKDETDGIRGMAHMFEHMMFRGSKNYPGDGDVFIDSITAFGGESNAYTSFDRTVYYDIIPADKLAPVLNMEADRMDNLVLDQKTLDVERQVVGEELRNGQNNQAIKVRNEVYDKLYPEGHPYRVDVIGYLPQIVNFTTEQCQKFYDNYYSPNNAVLLIVGDVDKDDVFAKAGKAFGGITKQVHPEPRKNIPDIFSDSLRQYEFSTELPVQLYGYAIPKPAAGDPDLFPFLMLKDLLFTNPNSILRQQLVNEKQLAYGLDDASEDLSLYPSYCMLFIEMSAQPGNVKVKKIIAAEIQSIADDGIDAQLMKDYISSIKAADIMESYSSEAIASKLGMSEIYFNDYNHYDEILKQFEKITPEQLQQVAKKYFNPEALKVVNVKPTF